MSSWASRATPMIGRSPSPIDAWRGAIIPISPEKHSTRRMMRINAAFDAIRTAERRAEYDKARGHVGSRDGTGAAGRPPGRPSGSVLDFGRHVGWSIGEIARVDPGYLVWLAERREGEPYRDEIDAVLDRMGVHRSPTNDLAGRRWRRGFAS